MKHRTRYRIPSTRASSIARSRRLWALFFAGLMVFEMVHPTLMLATSGPTQPEFASFSPAGANDLVDPFTGDLNYNIPLMEVDGYPINMFYSSGVTMDQDASWVGLGWNLNVGSISRNLRGMPDDFQGDLVNYENYIRPNVTFGVSTGISLEIAGLESLGLSVGGSMGATYNNYDGVDITQGLNVSLSPISSIKDNLNVGLSLESSTKQGLSLYPRISLSAGNGGPSVTVGAGYNSISGLKQVTISPQIFPPVRLFKVVALRPDLSTTIDLGTPTYFPQTRQNFLNASFSGKFTIGGEVFSLHPNGNVAGTFSMQKLRKTTMTRGAFGYYYAHRLPGGRVGNAVLDFNREKDGPVTKDIPAIALAGMTYDVFSVQGQGVGGSYRLHRSDVGYVADATSKSYGGDGALDLEIGVGNTAHGGGSIVVNDLRQRSGEWIDANSARGNFRFQNGTGVREPAYFIEASEPTLSPDQQRHEQLGGDAAVRMKLRTASSFNVRAEPWIENASGGTVLDAQGAPVNAAAHLLEPARRPRSKLLSVLTRKELVDVSKARGSANLVGDLGLYTPNSGSIDHHFAQFTTTNASGKRFVYGVAAYNTEQHDVTFAVDGVTGSPSTVGYDHGTDNSTANRNGKDHSYQRTKIPAYAHSYLLTEILSPEYSDVDGTYGPSLGDNGDWVKFNYNRHWSDFGWRTPDHCDGTLGCDEKAQYSAGLLGRDDDNKANYVYGKKEVWYLDTIHTRDHVVVFTTSDREDVCSVNEDGSTDTTKTLQRLDRIDLYSRQEYQEHVNDLSQATPKQTVHLGYNYSLCPGASNINASGNKTGKLTLKAVRFEFNGSSASTKAEYGFDYGPNTDVLINPPYDPASKDRWGGIKANSGSTLANALNSTYPNASFNYLPNSRFPYVDDIPALADTYAGAWLLRVVDLPSGGRMEFDYGSDDYAYVQNRPAMKMFRLAGAEDVTITGPPAAANCTDGQNWNDEINCLQQLTKLVFKYDQSSSEATDYIKPGDLLYFNLSVDILSDGSYDNVPGYVKVKAVGDHTQSGYGYVEVDKVKINDNGGMNVSPFMKTAINYGRTYYSDIIFGSPNVNENTSQFESTLWTLFDAATSSSFVGAIGNAIQGINKVILDEGNCKKMKLTGSWIRLNDPDGRKMGGGVRVTEVRSYPNWSDMTDGVEVDSHLSDPSDGTSMTADYYGQRYTYELEDGRSSGVAAYEPIVGGDENPWRTPVYYSTNNLLVPDIRSYQEEPYGEMFFPAPRVGYSRVTVTPVGRGDIKRHGTGHTVHEFHTGRDFPVFTQRTERKNVPQKKPFSIGSLLKFDAKDHMTVSQGFSVQLNDMHGKPKKVSEFAEGASAPYKFTEYKYKETGAANARKLKNTTTVVSADGRVEQTDIGLISDMHVDMRESSSKSRSVGVAVNVDVFIIGMVPVPLPMIIPSYNKAETKFRSVGMTKVTQRFALVDEVIQHDNGVEVRTKNHAYDAESGQVLLTSVQDHFDEPVYSMRFPAYWHYDGMGPSYRNEGATFSNVVVEDGKTNSIQHADRIFSGGDELLIHSGAFPNGVAMGLVSKVEGDELHLIATNGSPLDDLTATRMKIVRSGRRNLLDQDMATVTTLSDPIPGIGANYYGDVLDASATEFDQFWRTNCDCTAGQSSAGNAYLTGLAGIWRPKRTYSYLTDRLSSRLASNNIDIRTDGTFLDFNPHYRLEQGTWQRDPTNWTFVEELVDVDPQGHMVESQNALGIPSASTYSHGGRHVAAAATNAKYRQIGFTGFEDVPLDNCLDKQFAFVNTELTDTAHTGRRAVRVSSSQTGNDRTHIYVELTPPCDSDDCTLSFETTEQQNTATQTTDLRIEAINGSGQISFEYEVLAGIPSIGLVPGALLIALAQNSECKVRLKACDEQGCCTTEEIEHETSAP